MLSPTLGRLPMLSLASSFLGFIFLIFASTSDYALLSLRPAAFVMGIFMLLLTAVTYSIHLVFTLMRDHESWKNTLDS